MSSTPSNNADSGEREGPFSPYRRATGEELATFAPSSFAADYEKTPIRPITEASMSSYSRSPHHHNNRPASVGSGSGSDFYSEDDSEDSDGFVDSFLLFPAYRRHGLRNSELTRRNHAASGGGNGSSNSRRPSPMPSPSSAKRNSFMGGATRTSATDPPLSYFHRHNKGAFSLENELRCYMGYVRRLYRIVEEDRLPWMTDFADIHKLRFPRKTKEIGGRLNLNIPYYSANYIEIFYVVTMPFLFFYNTPFFVVTFLTMLMLHSISMRRKNTRVYGESVTVLGHPVSYRMLGHFLFFAFTMLFMFFNGLRTMMWVVILNLCIIVPHALLRCPTYFDDEELEKCRPKLFQYGVILLLLALDYLEGDVSADDDTESRRLVEQERKRLAAVLEKREAKD